MVRTFLPGSLLALLLALSACSSPNGGAPTAHLGLFDLSVVGQGCPVYLAGDWRYYPNQLIDPAAVPDTELTAVVPHVWGDEVVSGIASYALTLRLPAQAGVQAIRVGTVSSAGRFYVNGRQVGAVGAVSADRAEARPRYQPSIYRLQETAGPVELVVHVSNHHHARGGLWSAPQIGTIDCLLERSSARIALTVFLITSVGVIGLYHLLLWLLRYRDPAALSVTIICALVSLRVLVTEEIYLLQLAGELPWTVLVRLEYASLAGIVIMSWRFLGQVYPDEFTRPWVLAGTWPSAIYLGLILLTPALVFTWLLPAYQVLMVAYIGAAPYLGWLIVKRGREGGWAYMIGICLMCVFTLHDIVVLAFSRLPLLDLAGGPINLLPFAYALMVFTQAGILAARTARSSRELELSTQELSEVWERLNEYTRELEDRVAERTAELEMANNQLTRLARVDGLTGLGNRRYFDEQLAAMWADHRRRQSPLGLLLVDVDRFKHFNDSYGHQQGDDALRMVAQAMLASINRPRDELFRYGGEELAALLPDTDLEGAHTIAERMRAALEAMAIPHVGSPNRVLTVSVGVAVQIPAEAAAATTLVEAADAALYAAKAAGRNRVTTA